MSAINLDFTVEQSPIEITVETNPIEISPQVVTLELATASIPILANTGELLYNLGGLLQGVPNTLYDGSNLTLGDVSNIRINGGINGYFLQTDGTGNLDWALGGGGGGNGSPGGANRQIQYNDSGAFGGNVGFTFNEVNGNINIPGNVIAVGTITGANANLGNSVNANYFIGNLYGVANTANIALVANSVNGSNVSGQVANALVAGTVYTNAQPNITSVGTLTNLSISANLSINGTTSLFEAIENVAIIGAQVGTYNYNMLDGAIQYSTANATANLIINFRGNSTISANTLLPNAKSITSTYILTTGTTPYSISNVQIDSVNQSIKWVNGTTPIIVANTKTAYTFTIIKTSTVPNYDIFASATRYQ